MTMHEILSTLIERKYQEIKEKQQTGMFEKIFAFEANAIGQIGEAFVKEVFKVLGLPLEPSKEIVHDECDLHCAGKKIEVKTARKGVKKDTFQFGGINPKYNYDYMILLGITANDLFYYIIDKKQDHSYKHKERKDTIRIHDKEKQLVARIWAIKPTTNSPYL